VRAEDDARRHRVSSRGTAARRRPPPRRRRPIGGLLAGGVLLVLAVVVAVVLLGGGGDDDAGRTAAAGGATTAATAPDTASPASTTPAKAPPLTAEAEHAALAALAAKGMPVYCGGKKKGMVALTFDDGPGPYTHYVLKRLRRNKLRATFFLVSRNLPIYGDLVAKELQYGTVANHTRTHPNLAALSPEQQEDEIVGAQKLIAAASKRPVQVFRPPYGQRTSGVDEIAKRAGMVEVLWTVDSADSLGANYAGIQKNVIAGLKPGAIILMHDNRGQTVRGLPKILHALKKRHLRAVTVQELLTVDPPSDAQLKAGRNGCGLSGAAQLGSGPAGG
jgi:peptidoglycan/xylan/chitin deacetylase (PgdA/CDA1 family)